METLEIAVITMSSLSLVASCATLYLMYKTNQSVTGGVEQAKAEVEVVKQKVNRNAAVVKTALNNLEF